MVQYLLFKKEKMKEALIMLALTIAQNASFTLVSRARNSKSIMYHFLASIGSNGIWLLVFRHLSVNLDNVWLNVAYLTGAVSGSILMHWFAMKYLEKPKTPKLELTKEEIEYFKEYYKQVYKGPAKSNELEKLKNLRADIANGEN